MFHSNYPRYLSHSFLKRFKTSVLKCVLFFTTQVLLAFMVGMTNLYTYYGYYDAKSTDGGEKEEGFKAIKSFEG